MSGVAPEYRCPQGHVHTLEEYDEYNQSGVWGGYKSLRDAGTSRIYSHFCPTCGGSAVGGTRYKSYAGNVLTPVWPVTQDDSRIIITSLDTSKYESEREAVYF